MRRRSSSYLSSQDLPLKCFVRRHRGEEAPSEFTLFGEETFGHAIDRDHRERGLEIGFDEVVKTQSEPTEIARIHEQEAVGVGVPAALAPDGKVGAEHRPRVGGALDVFGERESGSAGVDGDGKESVWTATDHETKIGDVDIAALIGNGAYVKEAAAVRFGAPARVAYQRLDDESIVALNG